MAELPRNFGRIHRVLASSQSAAHAHVAAASPLSLLSSPLTPLPSLCLPRRHLPSQTTLTPLSFQRSDFEGFTNYAKSPEK
ncbi:hypothetical protein Droror1_Dr00024275, partial [Drosera rotundifolia]